ncbi:MAG: hypothetical protein CL845_07540 [Crocinitomicaceae bacterium]|nr:hypothetical protein [Crocinitomicaceae bacterium]
MWDLFIYALVQQVMGHASMQLTLVICGILKFLCGGWRIARPINIFEEKEIVMRATLFIAALFLFTPAQGALGSVDLVSSDSLEIKISQYDSLYKEVLRLHTRADELHKMALFDIELGAILVSELARTQQMKKIILGGLDLSFSEFAAKVSPRSANGSSSAERALIRQNKKIENRLRRTSKQRIHPLNMRLRRMCEADNMLEWSACVSPYHAFKSNQTNITLTASNALVDSAIEQMRLKSKTTKPLVIVSAVGAVALLTAVMVPLVVFGIYLSGP